MLNAVGSFLRRNLGATSSDYSRSEGMSGGVKVAVAGAWALTTTGVGAAIGAARQARDVVTVEHVPYAETVRVAVGSHQSSGCYDYHYGYNPMSGDFEPHYGYNPSCTETVTDYQTRHTGRTLYQEVRHHTVGFPNTVLQGALVGLGIGVVTGVAGLVIAEALKK